ncbi:MAG: SulP family inorganic anion transporter [Pseudanabaenales cyanobacterium]|nr:SulP family inorganic anion transporter [Pseudanabaenales cyanobacterium]
MQLVNALNFKNLRGDLFGGLTAAIVALPLALAFGVSSGAGPITGLYGAISVGFFAALFGGTPSQISGPTGPMTVVMTTVFTALIDQNPENGLAMAFTVVMLGGIFQILFGVLRLGQYITLMPYTVISGFMSGIGVIIIILQLGPLLGHDGGGKVVNALQSLPDFIADPNLAAAGLGILTLVIVFGMPRHLNRVIPAPLLALVVCTLLSLLLPENSGLIKIGDIPTGWPKPQLPTFQLAQIKDMLGYGVMLAMLGSIDSLLTSLVADNITRTEHNSDRELIGQGLGNLISGLVGGLPGAGATMRTVVNVNAGGKTPLSGIVHALVLLVILLGAGKLTANIPNAVLAGILIKVGIDIIDWSFLKRAHRVSRRGWAIMYGVLFLTVFVDLITAVAAGAFIANLFTIKRLSDLQAKKVKAISLPDEDMSLSQTEKKLLAEAEGRILLFSLGGPMSFGAAKAISQQLTIVGNYDVLILDLDDVPLLGVTASLAIENIVKEAAGKRREIFIAGASGPVKARLRRLDIFDYLPASNRVPDRLQALQQATAMLKRQHANMPQAAASDVDLNSHSIEAKNIDQARDSAETSGGEPYDT